MPGDSGYISSELRVVPEADCGWQITSRPAQRIQLTLAAFGGDGGSSTTPAETDAEVQRVVDGGRSGTCHEVGSVRDGTQHPVRPLVICGPGHADHRPTHHTLLFQSESSSVVVRLKSPASLLHLSPFVIKYKGSSQNTGLCLQTIRCDTICSLPNSVVRARTVTTFEYRLHEFWKRQERSCI